MVYTFSKLLGDVMARMGEIAPPLSSLPASGVPCPADVVSVKIESMLPEAGEGIIREAPVEMLGEGAELEAEVKPRLMPCGLYSGEVVLPDDFLRLISVRLSGWSRTACRLVLPGDADWECQWSSEPGIAGCPSRPRAYLCPEGGGMMLRLVGSGDSDLSLGHLRILSVPKAPTFRFPSLLYPQLVATLRDKLFS